MSPTATIRSGGADPHRGGGTATALSSAATHAMKRLRLKIIIASIDPAAGQVNSRRATDLHGASEPQPYLSKALSFGQRKSVESAETRGLLWLPSREALSLSA